MWAQKISVHISVLTPQGTWDYNSIVMWAHIEKGMWGQNRTVASVWGHNSIVL